MGRHLMPRAASVLAVALLVGVGLSPAPVVATETETAPVAASAAADSALLQRILAQVSAHPVVHADFVQTRTSALLTAPALTRGTLVFARERGVIWQVRSPQPQGYVYGRQRSARIDADGKLVSLDAQPSAISQQINEWANAFMQGDTSGLASQFGISVTGTLRRWQVVLTPAQPQIAQAMRRLTLSGDTTVRTVTLETRRGETVQWQFDKVRTGETLDVQAQRLLRMVE
ncbi:hypothetical protein DBB29_17095 [Pandoraea cepalis]|uniref:Outer membrane lipoprotein carrier protein LolA n=1 Tax=Pandoraea cepalis TaxID=2508294 RepID=A0AAW7MNE4_9BURK|nr:outer membrane lipoprotein carrier protein LolA [Pandoraea cepalis]MDN4574329.1 hypothetical protein [Pandoraea cepalis]MDN4579832.1 hypothetical protein [Pandoraea cepalis]